MKRRHTRVAKFHTTGLQMNDFLFHQHFYEVFEDEPVGDV